ncbi:MAG: hypothetical protein RJB42_561 [Bacteroidota bacterium]
MQMRKIVLLVSCCICLLHTFLFSQEVAKLGKIQTTSDGRYLQYEDGTPFFWLGDTAWELFHRLTKSEIEQYLENRRGKGFNVIQAVALAEFNGLLKPNMNGDIPFNNLDPEQPNEKYFAFVDEVIASAAAKGLYIGLLPTWGDKVTPNWGDGPVVFNEKKAYAYAKWLAKRYVGSQNIIWILGGDRPPMRDSNDWRPIWRAMAQGITDVQGKNTFITYHTWGGPLSTSQQIHNEPWLSMNMTQSGHGGGHDVPIWEWITRDRALSPVKPVIDAEPNYEDHPVNPWPTWDPANGYFRDYDVRKQTYRSVFAGAAGVTYGHHSVWQFWNEREQKINYADRYWHDALNRPGATQVGYLKSLILSRASLNRIPDQTIIIEGQGKAGEYATAFRDVRGRYLMVYLPVGKQIVVSTSNLISQKIKISWFNPRTGKYEVGKTSDNQKQLSITSPTTGVEQDWVLVIDAVR